MARVVLARTALADLTRFAAAAGDGRETGGIVLDLDEGLAGDVHVRRCGEFPRGRGAVPLDPLTG
jgi:hypothetical protein